MAEFEDSRDFGDFYDKPQRNNRTWLIVAIVAVIGLVCCCCLALVAGLSLFGEGLLNELQGIADLLPVLDSITSLA